MSTCAHAVTKKEEEELDLLCIKGAPFFYLYKSMYVYVGKVISLSAGRLTVV